MIVVIILVGLVAIFLIGEWMLNPKPVSRNPKDIPTHEEIIEILNKENSLKTCDDLTYREVETYKGVGFGEGLLYLLFPIFGIICAIISRDSNPKRCRDAVAIVWVSILFGVGALILINIQ